nr:ribonuclease H-like domain, reverse transcriptase, RNA-dependent DNA polymerase [Tanacetum cinerariifolium]
GKYFRGRGRGKHKFSQGKNHERFKEERKDGETSHRNFNINNFKKSRYDTSKLQCFKCKKIRHIAPNCPQRTKENEQYNLVEEDLEPTLLMAILEDSDEGKQVKEVEEQKVSLHEEDVGYKETNMDSLWYLDNGASNHMTGVREHFKELDEKVSGKVRFGDGSYIEIKEKGSILIECDDEKQRIISHLYYIPNLKSTLLSLGKFTEIGCKVVMEDDELRLYDMDNKIFMKVMRQRNRLYKASLRICTPAEAVRHAIYILNSVPTKALEDITPYEAIKRRKPNLEKLRVFGFIAYAKVFKTKKDANGNIIKHKARLVAKGYIQEHSIDFEEVFAPVARMETIRLLLAIAANNKWEVHHLNVKSAFLHGELKEEVYVTQPEGFIKREDNGKVYRLIKALYGLRQASHAWNIKLDNTLKSLDFKKRALEQAIYTKTSKESILLVGVYVDDLIITGTPKKEIDKFKAQMEEKFEMSDLVLLAYYLGIEVTQTGSDISIKQSAYANKILKEVGMIDCNETLIPMDLRKRLTKNNEGTLVNSTEYRSLIGCLTYLLHTRPDLSYSVGLLSRFMQEPNEQHMKAIRQILRYVKGTKDYGITYKHNGGNKIQGFSDSSYGVNTQEGKGTTGIIFYYGESPISWSTQKQATVALSSCESEFIAATPASTQALWLKRLSSKLTHSKEENVTIMVDNKSPIALMKNSVFHGKSKHIDTKYHFIRVCVEREDIQVEFVSGEYQKADIFTKALPKIKFLTMRQLIGLKDLRQDDCD